MLKLPEIHNTVVIGGGVLELYGLRRAQDIDMVVSLKNWRYLQQELGWNLQVKKQYRRYISDHNSRFDVWRWWFNSKITLWP